MTRLWSVHPASERGAAWDTGWRCLPNALIERPEGGSWTCEAGGRRLRVADGAVLVVPVGCHHRLYKKTEAMRSSWAYVSWQYRDGREVPTTSTPVVFPVALGARIDELWRIDSGPVAAARAQAAALEVLAVLLETAPATAPPADARVQAAIRHLREYYHEPLTRSDIARACHLSPTRLHELFTHATGEAPMRFLNRLRLQRAHDLLADGELGIEAIARRCGFNGQAYFTRVFTKAYGEPPGRYRQRLRAMAGG